MAVGVEAVAEVAAAAAPVSIVLDEQGHLFLEGGIGMPVLEAVAIH